jgi:hypothetical protein
MIITLENTSKIVVVNGVPARVWEGKTDKGIEVHAFITRIAVNKEEETDDFQQELQLCREPSVKVNFYPLEMIL